MEMIDRPSIFTSPTEITGWYGRNSHPALSGAYQRDRDGFYAYSYFDDGVWFGDAVNPDDAHEMFSGGIRSKFQALPWRGLTKRMMHPSILSSLAALIAEYSDMCADADHVVEEHGQEPQERDWSEDEAKQKIAELAEEYAAPVDPATALEWGCDKCGHRNKTGRVAVDDLKSLRCVECGRSEEKNTNGFVQNIDGAKFSSLKPEYQAQILSWIKDGTFVERAVGAMSDQERQIMAYEDAAKQAIDCLHLFLNIDTIDQMHLLEVDLAPKAMEALKSAVNFMVIE